MNMSIRCENFKLRMENQNYSHVLKKKPLFSFSAIMKTKRGSIKTLINMPNTTKNKIPNLKQKTQKH